MLKISSRVRASWLSPRSPDGQMIAVLSACSVMGFVKSMDAEGPYCLVDGRVVRGASTRTNTYKYHPELGVPTPPPKADKATAGSGGTAAAASDAESAAARAAQAEQRRLAAEREAEAAEAAAVGEGYGLLVPLLYAPLVPLMRVGLRGRVPPERLTQATLGVIAIALVHAGTYMFSDSSVAARR